MNDKELANYRQALFSMERNIIEIYNYKKIKK